MGDSLIPTLLVTANVGSIFEDPHKLLKIWVREVLSTISRIQPKFLALHCQEIGGKNYEVSMKHVEDFVRVLMASDELQDFGQVRVYLDEDFTCTEKFTALGNLYFVHNSLKHVQIWDFKEHKFLPVEGKEVHSGNIERVSTKEKAKFPQEFFPECKWSRKGFMRTRWNVLGTAFDLINIHLFHDASNFVAMESFPSVYSKNRRNALAYAIHRFATDEYAKVPYFIFGDFNFRLNTKEVVQKLTSSAVPVQVKSAKNGEVEKVLYKDQKNENKVILTLEKKVFDFDSHEEFFTKKGKWLQEFDKELETFQDELFEFDIEFPPSYPFEEDSISGTSYMRTRCPAWCDRILLNKSARTLINMDTPVSNHLPVCYELIGGNVAMGDHKPVMLLFNLHPRTGRLPPFNSKSSLEACILWSCIPGHRTIPSSSLFCSSEPVFLTRRTTFSSHCEHVALPSSEPLPCTTLPIMQSSVLSSVWPFKQFNSNSSSGKWYMAMKRNCSDGSKSNSDDSLKLQMQVKDSRDDYAAVYSHSCRDGTFQEVPLHAVSCGSSGKYITCTEDTKSYKCCSCVLL